MFRAKEKIVFFICIMSVVILTSCSKTDDKKSNIRDAGSGKKTVLEMDMDADYSDSDPFEDGHLFCVLEDIEELEAEVSFQLDGESGTMEIKDRNSNEVLWSKTWKDRVRDDTFLITLKNLQKGKEYAVRFTGTKINQAVVKVTFDGDLVREKEKPSK